MQFVELVGLLLAELMDSRRLVLLLVERLTEMVLVVCQLTFVAVVHKTMNIFIKAFILIILFFFLSMIFAVCIGVVYEPPEKKYNSLLVDYAKEDIITQVVQDVGIIEEE